MLTWLQTWLSFEGFINISKRFLSKRDIQFSRARTVSFDFKNLVEKEQAHTYAIFIRLLDVSDEKFENWKKEEEVEGNQSALDCSIIFSFALN